MHYTKNVDVDNLAEAVMDACNNVVYKDDSQIVELNVKKQYGDTDHVLVVIEKL